MHSKIQNRIKAASNEFKKYGFLHVVRKIFIKIFSLTGISHYFSMKVNGFRLHLFPTLLTHNLYADSTYRKENDVVYKKFVRPGDIAIDVGANIGSVSLLLSTLVGEEGRVIAFEPSERFLRYFKKNIELNDFKNITAYSNALGEREEVLSLNTCREDDTTHRIELQQDGVNGESVQVYPLDKFTHTLTSIRLLKVDVEGFEKFVLLGAKETLKKTDVLYIEFLTKNMKDLGVQPQELLEIIKMYFDIYESNQGKLEPFIYNEGKIYGTDLICLAKGKDFTLEI